MLFFVQTHPRPLYFIWKGCPLGPFLSEIHELYESAGLRGTKSVDYNDKIFFILLSGTYIKYTNLHQMVIKKS